MDILKNNLKYLFLAFSLVVTSLCFCQDKQDENQEISEKNIAFAEIGQPPYPDRCRVFLDDFEELRQCFSEYVNEIVMTNFNPSRLEDYPAQTYRVLVQFVIDTDGKVKDVRARGPYREMEEEAIRVVKKIPQINPGKHKGKKVSVLYGLPINFALSDTETKN